jgi:hypothetical protein
VIALRVQAGDVGEGHVGLIVAHDVRNAAGTKFLIRKGGAVEPGTIEALRALGGRELHLLRVEPDELHENDAGGRLARAVAGPRIDFRGPFASEFTFMAAERGLLRVDAEALYAVNDLDGITVFTRFDYQPVEAGDDLAGAKVTPLRVLPFAPRRVAALVMERVDARSRDRFQAALELKLAWYGSELALLREVERTDSAVDALRAVLAERPDLVMVAGASSLDPLEPLFGALRELDARVVKHGVPVDPGSLFWLAYVGSVPVFGLASSEMFSHKTVVELVLPRLFAGEPVGREELVRLGVGGFLRREMAFRFPAYGEPAGSNE